MKNVFFKFMSMILKNHMFKIYLSRFLKNGSRISFTFSINGHRKFTYALSISKVKILIYQSFNVKMFLNMSPLVNLKNTFDLLLVH
jgi:hypothetical protein